MVIRMFQKNNLYLRTKSDYVTKGAEASTGTCLATCFVFNAKVQNNFGTVWHVLKDK